MLFLAPFVDVRRPLRLLHLDLLVLLAFGVSHVFFNRGEIGVSAPLVYPVLLYLLVRVLFAGFRPAPPAGPLVPHAPLTLLVVGLVFLMAFRIGLNVADSNVIDVGYAGVIGADRIVDGDPLYGEGFSDDVERGDTYGPVNYLLYVPFEQALPWSGRWDDLPAAHGAAIAFDLLVLGGLLLLGRRLRPGRRARAGRGARLRVGGLPVHGVRARVELERLAGRAGVHRRAAGAHPRARAPPAALWTGVAVGLGAAAKFVPLALAPLFARRAPLVFGSGAAAGRSPHGAAVRPDGGLRELYDRTVGYQAGRPSPFSIWGQVDSLDWLQTVLKVGGGGSRCSWRSCRGAQTRGRRGARRGGADRRSSSSRRTGSTSTSCGSCRSCWSRSSPRIGGDAADEPSLRQRGAAERTGAGLRRGTLAGLGLLALGWALTLWVAPVVGRARERPGRLPQLREPLLAARCPTATSCSSTRRWRARGRHSGLSGTGLGDVPLAFATRTLVWPRWWCCSGGARRADRRAAPRRFSQRARCRSCAGRSCARTSTSRRWVVLAALLLRVRRAAPPRPGPARRGCARQGLPARGGARGARLAGGGGASAGGGVAGRARLRGGDGGGVGRRLALSPDGAPTPSATTWSGPCRWRAAGDALLALDRIGIGEAQVRLEPRLGWPRAPPDDARRLSALSLG